MSTKTPGNDDPLALAADLVLSATDAVQRLAQRRAVSVEKARSAALGREARRLAFKYGATSTAATEAAARAEAQRTFTVAAQATAERSQVPVMDVADDRAVVHGRVVDASGRGRPGLVVTAREESEKKGSTQEKTDDGGYFAFQFNVEPAPVKKVILTKDTIPTKDTTVPKEKETTSRVETEKPGGTEPAKAPTAKAILLDVTDGNDVVFRDREPMPLRPGRAVYREIVVKSKK